MCHNETDDCRLHRLGSRQLILPEYIELDLFIRAPRAHVLLVLFHFSVSLYAVTVISHTHRLT